MNAVLRIIQDSPSVLPVQARVEWSSSEEESAIDQQASVHRIHQISGPWEEVILSMNETVEKASITRVA